ncbi:MAG TPA: FAD-linked oxidase C-terminal domain-containing protein [Herpetosiphonaceae bacterium]
MPVPIDQLRALLGDDKVSTNQSVLEAHGRDENFPDIRPPLAVAYAERREDIEAALGWCRQHQVPVIPFGAGSSLEGALIPPSPGAATISLDLSRMNRVLSIEPENFLAVVEPGVTRSALNAALRHTGLFFPVDPGADAALGGMAATNASGTTTVRYGGMRQNTLALEAVLANGEVLQLGRPVRKTSSGYDLKDLLIGSSGTLGVISKLWVRLHPVAEHVHALRVFFPTIQAAAEAAALAMGSALPVARLELLDERAIRSINRYLGRDYREAPALFMEFHSSTAAAIAAEVALAEELAREAGALEIDAARTQAERTAQWEARHHVYWALVNAHPNQTYAITDTAVPLAQLAPLIGEAQQMLDELGLEGSILGHVGDGNFHTLIASERGDERARRFAEQLNLRALALGGTVSGEHGVGLVKRPYMAEEHGPALEWMRRIKALFDPDNLLNPGKIV